MFSSATPPGANRGREPQAGTWPEARACEPPWDVGASGLSVGQKAYLEDFCARYVARTAASQRHARSHPRAHAEPRPESGPRSLGYPIVARASHAARFVDVDGNTYIDLGMAGGAALFGHAPGFLLQALHARLARDGGAAPPAEAAAEAAQLLCTLTGAERALFADTPARALTTALHLARRATGRRRVALLAGPDTASAHMAADALRLPYAQPAALATLRAQGDALAAVIVKPVQARRPELQPVEFLRELRRLTAACGAALVFDESVTGLRLHPAGAQGYFGVQADLAVYGAIVASGLPIGAVAGAARFVEHVGASPRVGDDGSEPQPLALAAACATLRAVQAAGPDLYAGLEQKAGTLQRRLNAHCEERRVALRVARCGSLFRFTVLDAQPSLAHDLFFRHLLHAGVYVAEGRTCFLSAAHTDPDCDAVHDAVATAVEQLLAAGFWTRAEQADSIPTLPSHEVRS